MIHRNSAHHLSLAAAGGFAVVLAALLLVALFPIFPRQFDIHVNDTSSRTLRSPRTVSFESAYLANQRREEAANAVPESVAFDPKIRDAKIEQFDRLVGQVTQIRNAPADAARKHDELVAAQVSPRSADVLIAMPADRWQAVIAEGRRLLNLQLGVSLDEGGALAAKDNIDSSVAPSFSADEALLAAEFVRPLLVPTLVADSAKTEQARQAARQSVAPIHIELQRNELIVNADSVVDEVAIEKLRAAGLLSHRVEVRNVAAIALLALVASALVGGYLYVMQPRAISSARHLAALALITALPLLVGKLYLPFHLPDTDRHFLAFLLPIAAGPILVAALLETDVAIVTAVVIGVLLAFVSVFLPDVSLTASIGGTDTMRVLLVYGLAPIAGIYCVHRADRLSRYLTAGLAVFAASYALLLSTWFIDGERHTLDTGWMALSAGLGGVSAGLIAAGAFVTVGVLFGVTTRVQLMELGQLNARLLRRLQDQAPGTFHHSVIVGNLAERAADLIGADQLLTRVGCYYHDIGKIMQPAMYIENQLGGDNPHEQLSSEESAARIRRHVEDGLDLARRERLPPRVQAFIPEHHGTRLVTYFYRKAAEDNPAVDLEAFQYPGPRPQSRETAIVMLADSTEALVRSSEDRSPEQIERMVDDVIAERMAEGQLDDSDLTLRDLRAIATSFKATMRAVYHPRVQYPEPTPLETRRRVLRLPLLTPPSERPNVSPLRRRRRNTDR